MNENDMNHPATDRYPEFTEEKNDPMSAPETEQTPPSYDEDDEEPQDGLTFKWNNLIWGVVIFVWLSQGGHLFSKDWTIYLYLAVVVIIHELGHVIVGKSFGCSIKEMQVFFLPFVSYKSKQQAEGRSWRAIKWSLGVLPLGGVTVFKSRESDASDEADDYIENKPAWQRLLISAAGVLFNLATFLILYIALSHLSYEFSHFIWPLLSMSLILSLLNILPIYPLDGGAIVFAIYEMMTGRKPSLGFTKACGWIGCVFIILFFWVFPEWLNGILDWAFGLFF